MKKLIILALIAFISLQTIFAGIIASINSPSSYWHNLIIGIDEYNDKKINLQGSENDAHLLAKSLMNFFETIDESYYYQFEEKNSNITYLKPAIDINTLVNHHAQLYAINGWWDQTLNNIKPDSTIFFSFSGVGIPDDGLSINKDLTLKDTKILEWLLKAVDKRAKVILVLDTCSNIDEMLSGLQKKFKNKVVIIKPKDSKDTVSITVDNKQYGITSYLLSQIFLGKVLNEDNKPIYRAGDIKNYLIEEAKKYDREISIYGIDESNKDWVILPTKFEKPSSNIIVEDIIVGNDKKSDKK